MPGIFLCYRRDDSGGYARHLYDRLARQFGRDQIFMDVDDIPPGHDFVRVIDDRIRACNVMLVLIGRNWLTPPGGHGGRRIDDPADFVRLEIEAAFARNITVLPVLVAGAQMPPASALPGSIARLSYLNAFEIYDKVFHASVNALLALLRQRVKASSWTDRAAEQAQHAAERLRALVASAPRHRRIVLALAGSLLLLYLIAKFRPATVNERPASQTVQSNAQSAVQSTRQPGPTAPEPPKGLDADAPLATAIEVKPAVRVASPPPPVAASRYIADKVRSFAGAAGPRNPKVLWKAAFPSLGTFAGLAGDGTLYFEAGDTLQTRSVYAIREGRQRWGYEFRLGSNHARVLLGADGLVWVEQEYDSVERPGDRRLFAYNSRGEGGLTPRTDYPEFASGSRVVFRGWGSGGVDGWSLGQVQLEYKTCELGELAGNHPAGMTTQTAWKLKIEGTCAAEDVNDRGELITATDATMLYCVNSEGRLRWKQKIACNTDRVIAVGRNGAVYVCGNVLHGVNGTGAQWTLAVQDEDLSYTWANVDAAETLYLLTNKGDRLVAIDKTGKLLWRLPFTQATPLGLDKSGRMYVRAGNTLVCLGD